MVKRAVGSAAFFSIAFWGGFWVGFFCNSLETVLAESVFQPLKGLVHLPHEINLGSGILLLTKGNGFQTINTGPCRESGPGFNCTKTKQGPGFHPFVAFLSLSFCKTKVGKGLSCVITGLNLKIPEQRSGRAVWCLWRFLCRSSL